MRRPRLMAAAALAALALVATGCDGLSGTGDNQYISLKAAVVLVKPSERSDPVKITGTGLDGKPLDLASYLGPGKPPVVVNVWGSWCGPCVEEAPTLASASRSVPATFLGIDIRDTPDNALALDRSVGIGYPSFSDPSSAIALDLGRYAWKSPPTTYVLDNQGRVAAVITSEITSATTLSEIVKQTAAGQ